jgi:hypothetical protein
MPVRHSNRAYFEGRPAVISPALELGRAIAQKVSRRLPGINSRSGHVGFVVNKVAFGQVFSITYVSPEHAHSSNYSIHIYRRYKVSVRHYVTAGGVS